MVVSAAHRQSWQRRLQAEAEAIAQRRLLAEQQAQQAAVVLQARWPEIRAVWLFGSVLGPSFGLNSDLDLCVEGLSGHALLEAMEVLDEALLPDALAAAAARYGPAVVLMVPVPSERHRAELRTDLQVERTKLAVLVESLAALQRDDQLLAQAQELCGPVERTHLLKKALQALVERTRSGAGPGNQPSLKARS